MAKSNPIKSSISCYAFRLHPGDDVTNKLVAFVRKNNLHAVIILTCVGSVTSGSIRLANADAHSKNEIIHLEGRHEIASLTGTVCNDGSFHLHASLGDSTGRTISGHVMNNLKVFTTAEIIVGECEALKFVREHDEETGFDELVVCGR